jgi:hypothetical protein
VKYDPELIRGTDLVDVPERELVRYILNEVSSLYNYFNFVVEPSIGPIPRPDWDFIFLAEVPRVWLGLAPRGQPGDIDVIIVPTWKGVPRPDLSCAVEVKRLALRGPNWTKNVDRYGATQAVGLLRAGFPFVGILHLVVNRPGPEIYHQTLLQARIIDDMDHVEFIGERLVDMTGYYAAERQLQRMIDHPMPECIGLNAVALTHRPNGAGEIIYGNAWTDYRKAIRNPRANPLLAENIGHLLREYSSELEMRPADRRKPSAL